MRLLVVMALVACRGEPHVVDRPPPGTGSAATGSAAMAPVPLPQAVPVPADVVSHVALRRVAHGLKRPVLVVAAPGDARKRLFVVEQRGAIRILENGKVAARPFFTIDKLSSENEEGLLGLAFHPKFATNGKLYVHYTSEDMAVHIVEYRVSATDPDLVDPTTARELVRIEHPYSNHNGGNLLFGPDGKLYAGVGDGGAANDPHRNGQNPKALLAKIFRFDVDAPTPTPEIIHIGLRNPWRFWFDAKTSDLYIGDVGQNLWESVYVSPNDGVHRNFGWNVVEGNHCFDADTGAGAPSCDRTGFTPPVVDYDHAQGCSITGGVTYRGKALPALDGRYFYADFCTSLFRSFLWDHGAVRDHWDWKAALDRDGILTQISSFGVDADGEIYVVELTGDIYELVPR